MHAQNLCVLKKFLPQTIENVLYLSLQIHNINILYIDIFTIYQPSQTNTTTPHPNLHNVPVSRCACPTIPDLQSLTGAVRLLCLYATRWPLWPFAFISSINQHKTSSSYILKFKLRLSNHSGDTAKFKASHR